MRVFVRYDTQDENGQRRRDRNDKFGTESPTLIVPLAGRYLWEWYFDISGGLRRVRDGVCEPIPHTEFQAWKSNTAHIVYPVEHAILRDMDVAFCYETNKELTAYRDRESERREAEASKAKHRR
jgi:hypothetical protein